MVWLDVPVGQLLDRLGSDATPRPLLNDGDPALRLAELAAARSPLYEATAGHRIDAAVDPAQVVDQIAALLQFPAQPQPTGVGGGNDR